MAAIPTLPKLSENATMAEMIEHVAILQKTLTFVMSALDSTNITEVGGYLASDTDLMASNGAVGLSSADTGVNDLRIWAGDVVTGSAPFRVYEDGSMFASKATISGNINMTGGAIVWSAVSAPDYSQVTGVKPPTNADNTLGVLVLKKGDGTNKGIFYNTINDTYELDLDKVTAGTITAGRINTVGLATEKIYKPGTPTSYGVIGGTFGDLELYYNNIKYFSVYNETTGVTLKYHDSVGTTKNIMGRQSGFNYLYDSWKFGSGAAIDFTGATVTGISTTAKFG